jgi:hypothetical protein
VLETGRLRRLAGVGPGAAGARAGGGEDNLAAAAGREDEVVAAQGDGFFRAQRRVVQAAEERGQLRLDAGDLGQDRPDLRRAGDSSRAEGRGGAGRAPAHQADGVGGQQPELDGVAEAPWNTARLRVIVFAAAGEPSSRVHSPSRTARVTRGSLSRLTGREARSSQASASARLARECGARRGHN